MSERLGAAQEMGVVLSGGCEKQGSCEQTVRVAALLLQDREQDIVAQTYRHLRAAVADGKFPLTGVAKLLALLPERFHVDMLQLLRVGSGRASLMPVVDDVVQILVRSESGSVRFSAREVLVDAGQAGKDGILRALAKQKDQPGAAEALRGLLFFELTEAELNLVASMLASQVPDIRFAAAEVFDSTADLAPSILPEPVIRALLTAVDDEYVPARTSAVGALRKAAPNSRGMVVERLVAEVLTNAQAKEAASRTIAALGADVEQARRLLPALEDESAAVRLYTLVVLEKLGPEAREFIEVIEMRTHDKSEQVQEVARRIISGLRRR